MLNITHYQRNANQNQIEYHLMPFRMAIIKKSTKKKKKMLERVQRKGNPSTLLVGMQPGTATGEQCGDFLKHWG